MGHEWQRSIICMIWICDKRWLDSVKDKFPYKIRITRWTSLLQLAAGAEISDGCCQGSNAEVMPLPTMAEYKPKCFIHIQSFTFFKDLNALIPDFFLDFQTFFLNLCIPQQVTGNDATNSTEHLAFTPSALSTSGRQPTSYKQKYFQSRLFTSVQKGKIKCVLKMLFFW